VKEEAVLAYVRANIRSVSTLELLLLLERTQGHAWRPEDLVRELRSSSVAVSQGLDNLKVAGLVAEETGRYAFKPSSTGQAELASSIEALYRVKPITLIKAIITDPAEKLRQFSDAFKLKDRE
jgi:predicted transcriptional regulator